MAPKHIKLPLLALAMILFCAIFSKGNTNVRKPNFLFFLVDDMGWMDAGYQGSKFYETPHLDRLANEGIRFTNAYSSFPRCLPSRYSIITGKNPARDKVPGSNANELRGGEITLAVPFQKAGYSTFFTGKWHLAVHESYPQNQGFDINIAGGNSGAPISYFFPYNEGTGKGKGGEGESRPISGLETGSPGEYLTDRITNETIQYLKKHHSENPNQPFLAYVSHYAVHAPFQAKTGYIKKFTEKLKGMPYSGPEFMAEGNGVSKMNQDNAVYAAMLYSMDESLGKILATLKETGDLENTIVIFFSDNGGLSNRGPNQRELATSNLPLRAGKGHLYEGGIREPMIVKWPGVTKPGSKTNQMIIGSDFFPTMLEMAGLPLHPEAHLDGQSFVWALKGAADPDPGRVLFWHSPVGRPNQTGDLNSSALRKGDYKLIDFYDEGRIELYNLKNDPSEKMDLSREQPQRAKELRSILENWKREISAIEKEPKGKAPKPKGTSKSN